METPYFDFHRQLERMILNTSCTCRDFVNMASLDLILFLHYGDYI